MTEPAVRAVQLPEAPDLPYRLGRGIQHDPRSRSFAFTAPEPRPIVDIAWRRRVGVYDQGSLGSCFPRGVHIRMADGSERPIEDVRLGEYVVTAEGNVGRVVRTMLRDEDGGLISLRLWGHSHLRMTREHPILTARGYVEARDLRIGDEVALPRYAADWVSSIAPREFVRRYRLGSAELPDKIELDEAFGRLFGLWLAEGSADGTKVRWHYGGHEAETLVPETVRLCQQALGQAAHATRRPNGTWWVTLYGTPWNELFKELGGQRVDTKRPHPAVCGGPRPFLRAVLDGWLAGDGWTRPDGSRAGVSVSHDLALAMYDIAQALGQHPVIVHSESPQNAAAKVRLPRWTVTMSPGPGRCRQDDRHVWRKVRELAVEDYVGPVYDLTVEGDHSYVAEGVGVHNCTANALCGALSTLPHTHRFRSQKNIVKVYGAATEIDPWPGTYPPDDTGSSGLAVAKVALSKGWISRYEHAFSFDAVLQALMVYPGITGTVWRSGMFRTEADGRLRIRGSDVGGHEYEAFGVDVDRRRIWFWNSWGPGWGAGAQVPQAGQLRGSAGAFYLTWDDYRELLAADGDYTVLIP